MFRVYIVLFLVLFLFEHTKAQETALDTLFRGCAIPILKSNFRADSIIAKQQYKKRVSTTNYKDTSGRRLSKEINYIKYNERGEVIEESNFDYNAKAGNEVPCSVKYEWVNQFEIIARVYYEAKYQDRLRVDVYKKGLNDRTVLVGDTSNNNAFHITYLLDLFPDKQIRKIRYLDFKLKPYDSCVGEYVLFEKGGNASFENNISKDDRNQNFYDKNDELIRTIFREKKADTFYSREVIYLPSGKDIFMREYRWFNPENKRRLLTYHDVYRNGLLIYSSSFFDNGHGSYTIYDYLK